MSPARGIDVAPGSHTRARCHMATEATVVLLTEAVKAAVVKAAVMV